MTAELVTLWLPLVRRRARLLSHLLGLEYEEAVQDGSLGLMRAAERHDPELGKFSTFAVPHIDGAIRDAARARSWRRRGMDRGHRLVSLNAHAASDAGDDAAGELSEVIPDTLRSAELVDLKTDVGRALAGLSPRERQVLYLRVHCDMTIESIAGALDTSEGSVVQSWHRAKSKLRDALPNYLAA